jgi:hypothetical protein
MAAGGDIISCCYCQVFIIIACVVCVVGVSACRSEDQGTPFLVVVKLVSMHYRDMNIVVEIQCSRIIRRLDKNFPCHKLIYICI